MRTVFLLGDDAPEALVWISEDIAHWMCRFVEAVQRVQSSLQELSDSLAAIEPEPSVG